MTTHKVGIIMNGVTGRMGTNQHLLRSIKAIIDQGGIKLSDSEVIMPDPILVGRSESKLAALAARAGVKRYSTDLDAALADPGNQIYFDATLTGHPRRGQKSITRIERVARNLDRSRALFVRIATFVKIEVYERGRGQTLQAVEHAAQRGVIRAALLVI